MYDPFAPPPAPGTVATTSAPTTQVAPVPGPASGPIMAPPSAGGPAVGPTVSGPAAPSPNNALAPWNRGEDMGRGMDLGGFGMGFGRHGFSPWGPFGMMGMFGGRHGGMYGGNMPSWMQNFDMNGYRQAFQDWRSDRPHGGQGAWGDWRSSVPNPFDFYHAPAPAGTAPAQGVAPGEPTMAVPPNPTVG